MKLNVEILSAVDCDNAITMLQHVRAAFPVDSAAAPAPAPAPAPATTAAPPPPPPPAAATAAPAPAPAAAMTQAEFGAAVQAYAKAHGPKAAKAKLADFGYGKTSDVPAEHYAHVASHLAV